MLERQYRCGCFEASVVVDNGELVYGGECGGEQVGHADRPMLAGSCQGSLCAERGLPMLVVGRQILVGGAAVSPELFVFGRPASPFWSCQTSVDVEGDRTSGRAASNTAARCYQSQPVGAGAPGGGVIGASPSTDAGKQG